MSFGCVGLFFIALPWAPQVQMKCAALILERGDLFVPLGIFLCSIGAVLGISLFFWQKRPYFQLQMKPPVEIEIEVIQGLLQKYWNTTFPQDHLKTDAVIHSDQKIELMAELPFEEIPKKFLSKIENEVGHLLAKQLGYKREFLFTFFAK